MPPLSNSSIEKILEQFDGYIVSLTWKNVPLGIFQTETLDLEVDELIQRVRIKLWKALKRQHLEYIKMYIRCIVQSEIVDLLRRRKPSLPLPVNEDGELYQEKIKVIELEYSKDTQDPLYAVEQEEEYQACIEKVSDAVGKLPPRQRYALLCMLKDKVEDCLQLTAALKERGYDVDKAKWPETLKEQVQLRASLCISRKKLRYMIDH